MDLNRLILQDEHNRPLLWMVIFLLGGTTLYFAMGMFARIRTKIRDPVWRAESDVWNWAGMLLLVIVLISMVLLAFTVCAVNIAWYARH